MKIQLNQTIPSPSLPKTFTGAEIRRRPGFYRQANSNEKDRVRFLSFEREIFIVGDVNPLYISRVDRTDELFVEVQDESFTITFTADKNPSVTF